jgi:hypothetical protein
LDSAISKAGIRVWASQKEKTNFGPVMRSCKDISIGAWARGITCQHTFGTNPLKKLVIPSFFIMLPTILKPLSGFSKFRFWIRVLITSRGADTTSDAEAPAMDATKFCSHVAWL